MQHYSKKIFHSTQVFFFSEERKVSPNALSALPKRRLRKLKRRKKKFFRRFGFGKRGFICSLCSVPEIKMEIKPFGFTSILCRCPTPHGKLNSLYGERTTQRLQAMCNYFELTGKSRRV